MATTTNRFLDLFQKLGLYYDLFTHTDTENHFQVSQDIFTSLLNNEYLYLKTTKQMYSPDAGKFLPDRYVEGTCPNCGYNRARGDQCDNCNKLFESAAKLINPAARTTTAPWNSATPSIFSSICPPSLKMAFKRGCMMTPGIFGDPRSSILPRNFVDQGLIGRAVTRDMDWGIPVPVEGYETKVLYVWFEAVIGYLSCHHRVGQNQW
ncbi:MAG: class I tRNA ligase family protein [Chloroflexi bacterium]|nr:class I tRNA ligase family protein [Chloroflexota bacterium]